MHLSLPAPADVSRLQFSPCGTHLAAIDTTNHCHLWNIPEQQLAWSHRHDAKIGGLAIPHFQDFRHVAIADRLGRIQTFNLETGAPYRRICDDFMVATNLSLSPDHSILAVSSYGCTAFYEYPQLRLLEGSSKCIMGGSFSPCGGYFLGLTDYSGTHAIFEVPGSDPKVGFALPAGAHLSWHPHERNSLLAVLPSGKLLKATIKREQFPIGQLSPTDQFEYALVGKHYILTSNARTGLIRVYTHDGTKRFEHRITEGCATGFSLSPQKAQLAYAHSLGKEHPDNRIQVVDFA